MRSISRRRVFDSYVGSTPGFPGDVPLVVTENSVRSENTEVRIIREIMVATTMSSLFVGISANYDFGLETVDTSASGDLSGIGDVYQAAMDFWWGFYSASVNPNRSKSIKLYYPNTWEFCGTKGLWSCAASEGKIWLIPAHANSFSVEHELSHQLNYEFWGDSFPNVGGSHDLFN